MDGCSLPIFEFKVAWRNTGDCWTRAISVAISSVAGNCVQRFSSNNVRAYDTKAAALNFIQSQDWSESGVKFTLAYAELIFKCAQDGKWSGQTSKTPGSCATCASVVAKQRTTDGVVVVSCNRTLSRQPDCCVGCNPTTHMAVPGTDLKCVSKCAPGTSYSTTSGWCSPCPMGQTSTGGMAPCLSCAVLLGDPNSIFYDNQCRLCGSMSYAASVTTCVKCPSGKYVAMGASTCTTCALRGHFVSSRGTCEPCASGTYFSRGECLVCPSNTFASNNGSTACMDCAVGHVSLLFTRCVPCPIINATAMPFAQYYQPGCNIRCTPGISYVRTSPYIRNGCGSCASVVAPVGTFISASDCTIAQPCNPRDNAYYITNGTRGDNCEWKCNVGFQRESSTCVPCKNGAQFSQAKHVMIENCKYTCRPGLYVDLPHLFCNISCINLLDEVSAGRIKSRVREYGTLSRPNYVHGYVAATKHCRDLMSCSFDLDDGPTLLATATTVVVTACST